MGNLKLIGISVIMIIMEHCCQSVILGTTAIDPIVIASFFLMESLDAICHSSNLLLNQ